MDNLTQKLFKQFVAWACDGCSVAPLTDYINNPIYQELVDENQYDGAYYKGLLDLIAS